MKINLPFPIISMNFKYYIFSKNNKGVLCARNYAKFSAWIFFLSLLILKMLTTITLALATKKLNSRENK